MGQRGAQKGDDPIEHRAGEMARLRLQGEVPRTEVADHGAASVAKPISSSAVHALPGARV